MLKIKWTDGIRNAEVFQRTKEERLSLNISKLDATHGQGIQLGITSL